MLNCRTHCVKAAPPPGFLLFLVSFNTQGRISRTHNIFFIQAYHCISAEAPLLLFSHYSSVSIMLFLFTATPASLETLNKNASKTAAQSGVCAVTVGSSKSESDEKNL